MSSAFPDIGASGITSRAWSSTHDPPRSATVVSDYLAAARAARQRCAGDWPRDARALLGAEVVDLIVLDLKLKGRTAWGSPAGLRDESAIPIVMLNGPGRGGDRVMGSSKLGAARLSHQALQPARAARAHPHHPASPARRSGAAGESRRRYPAYRSRWAGSVKPQHPAPAEPPQASRWYRSATASSCLLVVAARRPSRILSRDQLLDLSRLHNDEVYNRSWTCRSCAACAAKIEKDPAEPRYIRTERGAGYLFVRPGRNPWY